MDAFRDVLTDMLDRVKENDARKAADCVLLALSKVYKYNGVFPMAGEGSCVQPTCDCCPICLEDLSTDKEIVKTSKIGSLKFELSMEHHQGNTWKRPSQSLLCRRQYDKIR